MENKYITKKQFVAYMSELKNVMDYQKSLNKLFEKFQVDGYLYQPDCSCALLTLLHNVFKEADEDNYIEKFCFDANFGVKTLDKVFYDKKRNEVKITSAEELYDLLMILSDVD